MTDQTGGLFPTSNLITLKPSLITYSFMKRSLLVVLIALMPFWSNGQIFAGLDQVICGNDSVDLGAQVSYVSGTALSMTDDVFSGVIPLGFSFQYFGNTYDKILFSSNNYITFDTLQANQYSNWQITGPAPTPGNTPANAIMGPWQDINPGVTGPGVNGVLYGTYGPPGARVFVAAFCEVPMFSCTNLLFSSQIKLFEADNHIEMHLQSKPLCTTWNNGQAIHGITNSDLSTAVIVPGRNAGPVTAPLTWNANQDGYAYFPVGNSYIDFPINFSPTIFNSAPPPVAWYDSTGALVGTGDSITVLPPGNMTYYASAFICGAQQTISDTVEIIFSGLQNQFSIDSTQCKDGSDGAVTVNTSGNAPPFEYLWSTGSTATTISGLAAGSYLLTVTDFVGCSITDTVTVYEPDSLQINPVIVNDRCGNLLASIIPNITGGVPPYQISWDNGAQGDTLSGIGAGTYVMTCVDGFGCTRIDTFPVTNQDFTLSLDSLLVLPEACSQVDGLIEVTVSGGTPPYSYTWSNGLTGSPIDQLIAGNYSVTALDVNGCSITDSYTVPFHFAPLPGFAGPDTIETSDPTAFFYDTTQSVASWLWNFGDGGSGIDSAVSHVYNQEGEYLVTMTVTDSFGCTGITTKTLFVVEEFFFYVPNAFTPNDDNTNDIFIPRVIGADPNTYVLQVYSRSGQLMFETTDLFTGWDGMIGETDGEAIQDVYTYRLYFRTFSDREVVDRGTVTLLR